MNLLIQRDPARTSHLGTVETRVVHFPYSEHNWGISQLYRSKDWLHQFMDEKRAPRDQDQPTGAAGKNKKLYQKPAFRYERVFETLALSCGKVAPTIAICVTSRKTS